MRKGIILAGGSGTRLYPLTIAISKQIMPVYDKPMIYYPLTVLMQAGIRDILVISTKRDVVVFKELLGSGEQWGMHFSYAVQQAPNGLAEAFLIGETFIERDNVAMVLGDNLFYGAHLEEKLKNASERKEEATIFGSYVKNPKAYGVVSFDKEGKVLSIEEKPEYPKSNYAVPGLYFYPNDVVSIAKTITPSKRNELEITAVNNAYLEQKKLRVELLEREISWFDTGTHDSLIETGSFVQTTQKRHGVLIGSPEETAFLNGWIDDKQLYALSENLNKTEYGQYLKELASKEDAGLKRTLH